METNDEFTPTRNLDTPELNYVEVIDLNKSNDLVNVLAQRGSRYGAFIDNATVSQDIKCIMEQSDNWNQLDNDMKEALQMIAHKISRILTGDFMYDDSWIDIAGYAKLVSNRLQGIKSE